MVAVTISSYYFLCSLLFSASCRQVAVHLRGDLQREGQDPWAVPSASPTSCPMQPAWLLPTLNPCAISAPSSAFAMPSSLPGPHFCDGI